MRRTGTVRTLVSAGVCALVIQSSLSTALARPGRVRLTNGESSDVEVVRLAPGQQITVRLADGTERVLPWAWIETLELAPVQPPAAQAEGPPQPGVSPQAAAAAAAPEAVASAPRGVVPTGREAAFRRQALKTEYNGLKEQRPGLGLPITLLCVGMTVAAGGLLGGAVTVANNKSEVENNAAYSIDPIEKTDPTPFWVVGGLASAAAVGTIAWIVSRVGTRSEIDEKMQTLKQEIDRLEVSLTPLRGGASAGLRWSL